MTKKEEELQHMLAEINMFKVEREISDRLYAKKIVETIVFGVVGLITIGFFTVVVKFFINAPSK